MPNVLLESIAGTIIEVKSERVECAYPGRLVTALLALLATVWSLGVLFMVVGIVLHRDLAILPGVLVGMIAITGVLFVVRHRMRTMGRFVVDGGAGELQRVGRRGAVITRHPLSEVRFELRWDPFRRSFVPHYWLIARCPGASYRLGKGAKDEVTRARARLEAIREASVREAAAALGGGSLGVA